MLIFLLFSLVYTDDIVLIIVEYEELWIKAYRIEEDFGTTESAEALLRQSVQIKGCNIRISSFNGS